MLWTAKGSVTYILGFIKEHAFHQHQVRLSLSSASVNMHWQQLRAAALLVHQQQLRVIALLVHQQQLRVIALLVLRQQLRVIALLLNQYGIFDML